MSNITTYYAARKNPFVWLAALLSMLNSCASGVSVVNIDNGFGAGYQAAMIDHVGVRRGGDVR